MLSRSMTNMGITALEEIGDFWDIIDVEAVKTGASEKVAQKRHPRRSQSLLRRSQSPLPRQAWTTADQEAGTWKDQAVRIMATSPQTQAALGQMEMATARVSPSRRLFPRSHLLRQMPSPISPVRRGISVEELEKMSVDALWCESRTSLPERCLRPHPPAPAKLLIRNPHHNHHISLYYHPGQDAQGLVCLCPLLS